MLRTESNFSTNPKKNCELKKTTNQVRSTIPKSVFLNRIHISDEVTTANLFFQHFSSMYHYSSANVD